MKRKFFSLLVMSLMAFGAWADSVQGITVEYVSAGTPQYVQSLQAIGKIKFTKIDQVDHVVIEFKDSNIADLDLGSFSSIDRIALGMVDANQIATGMDAISADVARSVNVTAYPNPTANKIRVSGVGEGQLIRIFSSNGSVIYSGTDTEIDLSGNANGWYLLQAGKEVFKVYKK